MVWKIIGYGFVILFVLVVLGGVGYKIMQSTSSESQKGAVINNFTFEPHFGFLGGCARYDAPDKFLTDARPKAKEVKK